VLRTPIDLVWLRLGREPAAELRSWPAPRPLALRLSIAVRWASRIFAATGRVTSVRERRSLATMIVRLLSRSAAGVSSRDRLKTFPDNGPESQRSVLPAVVMPLAARTSRRPDERAGLVALRRFIHLPDPRRWSRAARDEGRFAIVCATGSRWRVEPRVLAPPPMVARMPQRTVVSSASQASPQPREFPSAFGFATGARSAWMPAAGAPAGALSPGVLDSVTEHVVREIDSRVRAKRERLGKV
jgi:hypothetical protein